MVPSHSWERPGPSSNTPGPACPDRSSVAAVGQGCRSRLLRPGLALRRLPQEHPHPAGYRQAPIQSQGRDQQRQGSPITWSGSVLKMKPAGPPGAQTADVRACPKRRGLPWPSVLREALGGPSQHLLYIWHDFLTDTVHPVSCHPRARR